MICYQCEYEWLNECHAMGLFGRSVARVFGNEPYSFFQLIEVRNNGHIAFINNIDRWVSQTPGESILQSPLKNCDWNNANLANDIFPDYNWIWLGQNESDIRREWQHIRVPIWANSRLFIFFFRKWNRFNTFHCDRIDWIESMKLPGTKRVQKSKEIRHNEISLLKIRKQTGRSGLDRTWILGRKWNEFHMLEKNWALRICGWKQSWNCPTFANFPRPDCKELSTDAPTFVYLQSLTLTNAIFQYEKRGKRKKSN